MGLLVLNSARRRNPGASNCLFLYLQCPRTSHFRSFYLMMQFQSKNEWNMTHEGSFACRDYSICLFVVILMIKLWDWFPKNTLLFQRLQAIYFRVFSLITPGEVVGPWIFNIDIQFPIAYADIFISQVLTRHKESFLYKGHKHLALQFLIFHQAISTRMHSKHLDKWPKSIVSWTTDRQEWRNIPDYISNNKMQQLE